MRESSLNHFHFPVSFGTILLSWNSDDLLTRIEWSENRLAVWQKVRVPAPIVELVDRFRTYFYQGEPVGLVPWDLLDKTDWTEFQRDVYRVIAEIPHGETRTYGWVAERMGKRMASRAVGQALRKNPLPILLPCHRVLSSTSIGGFMGVSDPSRSELQLKRKLMSLEEEYCNPVFSFIGPGFGQSWQGTGWKSYGRVGGR